MEELTERQKQILQTIIEDYIVSAIPVGSRTLSKTIALSSATIRNEMSDLEELGYLEQPHTSAGRVPSQKAYRFYVDHLIPMTQLSLSEIRYLRAYYDKRIGQTGEILSDAARVVSELTQYVSVVTPPRVSGVKVSSIQLMPVNRITAMVVLLTDTGMVQNTPIVLPRSVTPDELLSMSGLLNRLFAGKNVSEIHPGVQYAVENEIADQKQIFDTICAVLEARLESEENRVVVEGASKMLAHQEFSDVEKARAFLQLLEENDKLGELVNEGDGRVSVRIGTETGLNDMSIVTATYSAGNRHLGRIGVIGPTRMQYDKVLSVLEQVGQTLSEIFSKQEEDDHEEK
ncbi:MAG: heat-inducible transcription repressor HrcA [Clostridia bacterium]|nr:heat-inducible transcription repressor HrcA [Clostridia bacterium]